jgi:hypothetical protein
VADLFCDDLGGSRLSTVTDRTSLTEPGTAEAALIDQLQGSDLRIA